MSRQQRSRPASSTPSPIFGSSSGSTPNGLSSRSTPLSQRAANVTPASEFLPRNSDDLMGPHNSPDEGFVEPVNTKKNVKFSFSPPEIALDMSSIADELRRFQKEKQCQKNERHHVRPGTR